VVHISTHIKELSSEVQSEKIFSGSLDALTTNDYLYKLAVAGEGLIKFYNLSTWKEIKNEKITLPKNVGKVTSLQWASNGQLLICSTSNGNLLGYITSIPFVFSGFIKPLISIFQSFNKLPL
jgi:WD repeat-containing protein 19